MTDPIFSRMQIAWSTGVNVSGDPESLDTVLDGYWFLPQGSGVAIRGAKAAAIRVESGDVTVLACGDDGKIDPTERDHQPSVAFTNEATRFFENDSYFYLEFGAGTTEFWIFGSGPNASVHLEILGTNGEASVCDFSVCWDSPELPPRPERPPATPGICNQCGGGCAGVRCWAP
jgi:hypothetical protein